MLLPGALAYLESEFSGKKKKKMPTGIVKTSGGKTKGKTQVRMTDISGFKSKKRNRLPYDSVSMGHGYSLSAAQKAARSFTETERKRQKKGDMGKYAPGTLGRKYKPKFKTVKIDSRTSRLRYVDHQQATASNAVYVGFNDVGPVEHFCRSAAEAMLLYYMGRVGETRTNQDTELSSGTTYDTNEIIWGKMRLNWRIKLPTTVTEGQATDEVIHAFVSGGTTTINTFNEMAIALAAILKTRGQTMYELASVALYEFDRPGTNLSHLRPLIYDVDAGRHTLSFEAKAKFKIQNTTDADSTSDVHNKDNIHANPLDGLVYKFRNRVPMITPGFIGSLNGLPAKEAINEIEDVFSTNVNGVTTVNLAQIDQFKVPPPAPYTIFRNSAGRSKILIKPGEHRVLTLTETFNSSINAFLKKYMPIYGDSRTTPPGGNSLVIGLKPTFRTGTNEDLEVQTEIDRYFASRIIPRKLTSMPITNILS